MFQAADKIANDSEKVSSCFIDLKARVCWYFYHDERRLFVRSQFSRSKSFDGFDAKKTSTVAAENFNYDFLRHCGRNKILFLKLINLASRKKRFCLRNFLIFSIFHGDVEREIFFFGTFLRVISWMKEKLSKLFDLLHKLWHNIEIVVRVSLFEVDKKSLCNRFDRSVDFRGSTWVTKTCFPTAPASRLRSWKSIYRVYLSRSWPAKSNWSLIQIFSALRAFTARSIAPIREKKTQISMSIFAFSLPKQVFTQIQFDERVLLLHDGGKTIKSSSFC